MSEPLTERIAGGLTRGREATLRLVADLDDEALCAQPDRDLSPIAWHLGHVAFTEAQWLLGRCGGEDRLWKPFRRRWAQNGSPKSRRSQQPPREALLDYLATVREAVLTRLPSLDFDREAPLLRDGFVGWFVEAHEHQHRETIAIVRQLELERRHVAAAPPEVAELASSAPEWTVFEGGASTIGTSAHLAYDNEAFEHTENVAPFALSRTPATTAMWCAFREDGGYARRALWSDDGWAWRGAHRVVHPRGWTADPDGRLARVRLDGRVSALAADEPVVGVSFYEAEAYARWCDARLPTEVEWEHAARWTEGPGGLPSAELCLGLETTGPRPVGTERDYLGNVWEWTASRFAPYPGFSAFPYRGYSERYFDGRHRVLRGGSFATHPAIARPTFRNFYEPASRYLFSGVRCARDV